jgi:hypothetical protein
MAGQAWDFESVDIGSAAVIDTSVAHSARAYDYWLGGRTHYQADRDLGDAIMDAVPTMKFMARANRSFLKRAVTHLAGEAGISQFLDVGTGIPGPGNVHEVAQAINPAARVQYVDNDPIVLAHATPLLAGTRFGDTDFLLADLRNPQRIVDHVAATTTIDLSQPVALLLVAILMFFRDDEDPYAMAATLLDALPSGSYLVVSHPTADFNPEEMAAAVAAAGYAGVTLAPRDEAGVKRFFAGTELVDPGVVPVLDWRPEDGRAPNPRAAYYYAGIGRKP